MYQENDPTLKSPSRLGSISYFMNIPSKLKVLVFAVAVFGTSVISIFAQAPKQVKLRGQVVCSVCWFEASDRKKTPYGNAADIKCALDCSEMGLPQALAVEDAKGFTLYTLEP